MTGNDVETKRYLTKSRFKLAMECPTKLFYTGKPAIYPDRMREDAFLQALAEGGFQVGELAKIMFPGGIEIKSRGHDAQVAETAQELRKTDVTVFEAAIRHGDFFVRADILRKTGNRLDLIEVKAKSFDPESCNGFRGARGGIDSEMRPYLEDIAFQRHVLGLAFPQMTVHSFLMLADTSRTASVDGLNQRFRIRNEGGRPVVDVAPGTDARTIGAPVLACVNVDELVDEILGSQHTVPGATGTVAELAAIWARQYRDDLRISPTLGRQCGTCQFRTDAPTGQQQSGFHACWQDAAGLGAAEIARGTVLDLWNYRRKQALIADGKYLLSHVDLGDLANGKAKARPGKPGTAMAGLDHARRQEMQVTGIWPGSKDFFIDTAFLRGEMSGWTYPLHFIDFETSRVAIPFFAGQRPYANIAFQFSHHVVDAEGRVAHRTQFLQTSPGRHPNLEFLRALRDALGSTGTVFMWSPHENTTLVEILRDLEADPAPPADAAELAAFIRGLTTRKEDAKAAAGAGDRAMADLCRIAEKAFFHPATKGSSSIKKVLPAVMRSSRLLKERYGTPIYGARNGIPSLNFTDQTWWREIDGAVADPYRLLPPVFADLPRETVDALESDGRLEIAQGGAAMTAFARLQFEAVAPKERRAIEAALLRYCELDTLAMVMIYEAWRDWSAPGATA
jgi:hypothetical protein